MYIYRERERIGNQSITKHMAGSQRDAATPGKSLLIVIVYNIIMILIVIIMI